MYFLCWWVQANSHLQDTEKVCRGPDNIKSLWSHTLVPDSVLLNGPAKKIPLMCQSYSVQVGGKKKDVRAH